MSPRKLLVRTEKDGAIFIDRINGKKYLESDSRGAANRLIQNSSLERTYQIVLPEMKMSEKAISFPLRAYVGLNNVCNLNCRMCYAKAEQIPLPVVLTREDWTPVLDTLDEYGLVEIRLGESGEPTLNPERLTEFLTDSKSRGFYISLTTNGQFDGSWAERWYDLVDQPIFSIDGSREYHDWNRGAGTFDKSIANLKRFKGKTKELRINTILSKKTLPGLEELIKIGVDAGVTEMCLLQLRPYNKGRTHWEDVLSPNEWETFINETIPGYRKKFPGFYIRPDYDISGNTRPDRLVDKVSQCSAGTEAFGLRPVIQEGEKKLKVYGCGYLCDEGGDFVAAILSPQEFKRKFLEIWHDDSKWNVFRNPKRNEQCQNHCDHYGKRCFGQCTAMMRYAEINPGFNKYLSCPFSEQRKQ